MIFGSDVLDSQTFKSLPTVVGLVPKVDLEPKFSFWLCVLRKPQRTHCRLQTPRVSKQSQGRGSISWTCCEGSRASFQVVLKLSLLQGEPLIVAALAGVQGSSKRARPFCCFPPQSVNGEVAGLRREPGIRELRTRMEGTQFCINHRRCS